MRPITIDKDQFTYDEETQLAQNMLVSKAYWTNSVAGPPTKRRKEDFGVTSIRIPVGDALKELSKRLENNQTGTVFKGLLAAVTTGYKAATIDLLTQTGSYCAFCDTPLWSGLVAQPFKPLASYPLEAFSVENLFLLCPTCGNARGSQPNRQNTTTYALPTTYWKNLQDNTPLPFHYNVYREVGLGFSTDQLIDSRLVETTLLLAYQMGYIHTSTDGVFSMSGPTLGKVYIDIFELLPLHLGTKRQNYPKLNDLYQLRDLVNKLQLNEITGVFNEVNEQDLFVLSNNLDQFDLNAINTEVYTLNSLAHHFRLNNLSKELQTALTKIAQILTAVSNHRYVHICVKVTKKNLNRQIDTNIGHTIELLQLNNTGSFRFTKDNLDRRVELRTMAFFEALSQRQQWLNIKQLNETLTRKINAPQDLLTKPFTDQLFVTIRETGFWGVWLSVFGKPILQSLNNLFPGTATTKWQI